MRVVSLIVSGLILLGSPVANAQGVDEASEKTHTQNPTSTFSGTERLGAQRFDASDALIEQSWGLSRDFVADRAADGFRALLYGNRGAFRGHARTTARAYLLLTGDSTLSRAALAGVFHPRYLIPGSEAPTAHLSLAEYSLLWPVMLEDYYCFTGDKAYTEAMAAGVLEKLFAYFDAFEGTSGLLEGETLSVPDETSVLNAFYYLALKSAESLANDLGMESNPYKERAKSLRAAYRTALLAPELGLFADAPGSESKSLLGNALALSVGLASEAEKAAIVALIRQHGTDCAPEFAPYVIEACFVAGEAQLAYDLMTFMSKKDANPGPAYLLPEYVLGMRAAEAGWKRVSLRPDMPRRLDTAEYSMMLPGGGRVTARYDREVGMKLTVPPGLPVEVVAYEGESIMVHNAISHESGNISDEQWSRLEEVGWSKWAANEPAIWISVADQMLRYIRDGEVLFQARCATAEKGVGSMMNSLQTPLGWHSIVKKIGDDRPRGQVYRARRATKEIWQPGEDVSEDLVLTRILLLTGEEPGINKGGDVDSFDRNIYIHGTNDEARLGTPSSHGCIRLSNDDVIEAYRRMPKGARVLITEF